MITAQQKLARRGLIGGTLMTAIAGVNPWLSVADAWLELTGALDDAPENPAMEAGSLLERSVLDWLERSEGIRLERDVFLRDPGGMFCANIDAVCHDADPPFLAEAKTAGIVGPRPDSEQWGEPQTDQVPERVIVQVHHYFGVLDAASPDAAPIRLALVPTLLGGRGFALYRVQRDDELVASLRELGRKFWVDHVAPRRPPEDFRPSLDAAKRIRRQPGLVTTLPEEVVEQWINAREQKKRADEALEAAQAQLLAALGPAEAGDFSGGQITYMTVRRKAYQVAESEYRQLRLKTKRGEQ